MKSLKGYVMNHARPEGCIAERYLVEECTRFLSGYVKQAAGVGSQHSRNETFVNDTLVDGHPILGTVSQEMSPDMLRIAHRYVLFNSSEVEPYME